MLPAEGTNNPTSRFPIVTVGLIVACVVVFIWQLNFPEKPAAQRSGGSGTSTRARSSTAPFPTGSLTQAPGTAISARFGEFAPGQFEAGVVCPGTKDYAEAVARSQANPGADLGPFQIDQKPWYETLFTSMFMHGGWLAHRWQHASSSWVFGNNIEDRMGRVKFLLFYLLAGLIAVYTQALIDPSLDGADDRAPAERSRVSLGAYAVLFPRARVPDPDLHHLLRHSGRDTALILLAVWFTPSSSSQPWGRSRSAREAARGSPISLARGRVRLRLGRGGGDARRDAKTPTRNRATHLLSQIGIPTFGTPCSCSAWVFLRVLRRGHDLRDRRHPGCVCGRMATSVRSGSTPSRC